MLMLCDPFSQLRVSSISSADASRDCGAGWALAAVNPVPSSVGKLSWKPPWFATVPVNMPTFISL